MQQIANRKSSGADDIPAEFWKASGEECIDLLWQLCIRKTGTKNSGRRTGAEKYLKLVASSFISLVGRVFLLG